MRSSPMGQEAIFWQADVSDRDAVAAMFAGVVERFGRIDVVVSNAAMSIREPVVEAKWEQCARDTGSDPVRRLPRLPDGGAADGEAGSPIRRSRGKIVIISSVQSEVAAPPRARPTTWPRPPSTSSAMTLAVELADQRINVNVITPGWIDTPGERAFYSEEEIQEGGRLLPWGRIGTPEDIGKAVAFLASDDADYITGTILRVDGGYVVARSTVD